MATITLTPGTTYQTHKGWQAVAEIGQKSFPTEAVEYRDEVARIAVDELGINRLMMPCVPEQENAGSNDNADPFTINWSAFDFVTDPSIGSSLGNGFDNVVVPVRNRLIANGDSLYLTIKVPGSTTPAFMTSDDDEYAEFIEAAFTWINSNYSFVPDHIQIVNEPSSPWTATFIGNCVLKVQARLDALGWNPTFSACELVSVANSVNWFQDLVTNVPSALNYITEISYHCYGSFDIPNLTDVGTEVTDNSLDGSLQGEHIGHDVDDLIWDLTYARCVAWEQFALAFPNATDNGAQYFLLDDTNPASDNITWGSRTNMLRQYMKYIRPGHTRISASSDDGNFVPIAYKSGNEYVVVVRCNSAGTVNIPNLPRGNYGVTYTEGTNDQVILNSRLMDGAQTLSVSGLPTNSVLSVFYTGRYSDPLFLRR